MKAVVINSFGNPDVLELRKDISEPILSTNQVLINNKATSINPLDWKIRKGLLKVILGSKFPMILGNDVAGIITKCGANVTKYKVGDKVYCMSDSNNKFSNSGFAKSGAYSEYVATREDTLSLIPNGLTFAEAASLPLCCLTTFQVLVNKAKIHKGQKVLINGASGGVGVFAVQIAKYYGAIVTAVCSSKNMKIVKQIGADTVIDYKNVDWTKQNEKYDIIYDVVVGTTYKKCKKLLTENGLYISNVAPLLYFVFPFLRNLKLFKKQIFAWVEPSGHDLQKITNIVNNGCLKPVIDKTFSLEEIKIAHEYSESGRVVGKLVVTI
jgi:NADPH:quinone reductase-like Zn-dependent oxidoreductase